MPDSPLIIDAISKHYGTAKVLENISLALQPGEIFGLIGLNGAGKTTLIKIILDLAKTNQGQATIFGLDAAEPQARRALSYLPEKFQPSRHLKGKEYLALSLSYYGKTLEMEEAQRQAAGLDLAPEKLEARVSSYSKGMGQKLGLLGAFMIDVPLLVLDEPMSGLDPSARIKLKDRLLGLKAEGKTVFFSSHILSDIDEICDRIGIIHGGKLLFLGTPGEFKGTYGDESLERAFLKAIEGKAAA